MIMGKNPIILIIKQFSPFHDSYVQFEAVKSPKTADSFPLQLLFTHFHSPVLYASIDMHSHRPMHARFPFWENIYSVTHPVSRKVLLNYLFLGIFTDCYGVSGRISTGLLL